MEHYSVRLEEATREHHESPNQWSFECNPLTGTTTCAAWSQQADADTAAASHKNRQPSSLNDEETRPDPPIEAHMESQDRCSTSALLDVLDGLSAAPTNLKEATRRPDWTLWKEACNEEMKDLINNGTIEVGSPPADAKIVQSMIQFRLK